MYLYYPEPTNFALLDDNFLCNICLSKGITPPSTNKRFRHVYTHPLVRCKPRVDDPVEEKELSSEERILALERRTSEIDAKLSQVVGQLADMDRTLTALHETIVARSKVQVNGVAPNGVM